jgi:hypothetical protein
MNRERERDKRRERDFYQNVRDHFTSLMHLKERYDEICDAHSCCTAFLSTIMHLPYHIKVSLRCCQLRLTKSSACWEPKMIPCQEAHSQALKLTALPTQSMISTQTPSALGHCTRRIRNNRRTLRSLLRNYRHYYPDIISV